MLLTKISITFLFLVFIHDVEGSEEGKLINDDQDSNCSNGSSQSIPSNQDGSFAKKLSSDNDCNEYQNDFHYELINLTNNSQINITTDVMLLSFVSLVGLEDIVIMGYDNPTISCNNTGGIYFENCNNCTIIGLTWENCGTKNDSKPVIELHNSSDIIIQNCTFKHSVTQVLVFSEVSGDVTINNCKFAFNNKSVGHGIALYYASRMIHNSKFQFTISNCNFIQNGISGKSVVYISSSSNKSMERIIFTNISFLNNRAVPMYISHKNVYTNGSILLKGNVADESGGVFITNNSNVVFHNSDMIFSNNKALYNGGALHIQSNSNVTFEGNLKATVINNRALRGGFIYINSSNFVFGGNSSVVIDNNKADYGGAIYIKKIASVTFKSNSTLAVYNNQATEGGAIYAYHNSNVLFEDNSMAAFNNNQGTLYGGAITIWIYSNITYEGNSMVTVNGNQAEYGGGIYIEENSTVTFKGNSSVTIDNNVATVDGGGLYTWDYNSYAVFKENARVSFSNNKASHNGGALCFWNYCNVTFAEDTHVVFYNNSAGENGGALHGWNDCTITTKGKSTTIFNNNRAMADGGAVYINTNSAIILQGNSLIKFNNNQASSYGGSLYLRNNCEALFEESTNVTFYNNTADGNGGTLYAWDNCSVTIKGNSTVICNNNKALNDGGGLYINTNSAILFQENSTVNFTKNTATSFGGALRSNSQITFENSCQVIFNHNGATQGGAIFAVSDTLFQGISEIQFNNNKADTLGGALHVSNLTFNGNTTVKFNNNEAHYGGSVFSHNSTITMKNISAVAFINNSAENGGGIYISASTVLLTEHTNVTFDSNTAGQDGGAIYFDDHGNVVFKNSSMITLTSNTADNYGGAVYTKITQSTNTFNLSVSNFNYSNNTAGVAGNSFYIDVTESCNDSCFADRTTEIISQDKEIITSANKLELLYPAKCININSSDCEKYYINNVMLGQKITINPCLLDHYNTPAEVTQFKIIGENHDNYFIRGSEYASVSCNHTIEGISIVGNKPIVGLPLNYSILFTSYATHKFISANLVVELSLCHSGFQYQSISKKCECYNTNEIVHCSGSRSTIKRGYWFGSVTGIPTVTFCPVNYCNFMCCKITNQYYGLFPARVNQCRSHRSGTACGNCEEGYTLSFDSSECIAVNKCTAGQTTLIVTLTIFYWFIIIFAVFIIMHYQVGIGYFYAVIYYYSVVDILLGQYMSTSNILYGAGIVFSSIAKIAPQFLGYLCLMKNISGIDQQFIHYIHPLAVSVILIMISCLARSCKRLSVFVNRGIVRAFSFLLLLSYTSVAITSLLLMRSLTFLDVDKVYTYLSPDIQYFHGRHLAYGIIAITSTLLIVIGLPLLLLLEPFLNTKISFYRIQPLLDQFQGCYKEKYQWFASYYMISRLIIISIIIANLSEVFISQFLLIATSTIIALIHLVLRPYADDVLNMFDGVTLQLMVLVTVLPLFEYFDAFNSSIAVGIAFVLVILPLVNFVVVKIFTSKQALKMITKKLIAQFSFQNKAAHEDVQVVNKLSTDFVDLTIDDSVRRNAIICYM